MKLLSSLREKAKSLGFLAIGFSEPRTPPHFKHFLDWLEKGKYGQLEWLKKNLHLREDPRTLLEGCRTVISLAFPYPAAKASTPEGLTVARYASAAVDYHLVLRSLCRELVMMLKGAYPSSRARVLVDSAPILERSIAQASGIGFIGKNNMFVFPGHGSYLHLAEILSTAPIDFASLPTMESRCGDCRRCVEACPTGALEKPYFLDVSKCLAYLTVEHEGELFPETGKKMGNCFLGCDKCQEVCQFNSPAAGKIASLPSTDEILEMMDKDFSEKLGATALERPGLARLKRNILAIRTSGD